MRKVAIVATAILAGTGVAVTLRVADEAARPATAAEKPAPAPTPPGVPVTAGVVAAADVPIFLSAIGTVQAYNTVTIKSRVDGQVMAVHFTEGQEVKAGDPLVQIDPRSYQVTLEQVRAAKAKDEALLLSAEADLTRSSQLIGSGYRTVQAYDQQRAVVGQLQAAIKGGEALINMAQLNLGYADIRAPIAGRLGARLVDAGNLVRATDASGLVTITQVKPIYVNFTVAQTHLDAIREENAKEPLIVRAFSGTGNRLLAEGKLTMIDNVIEQASGTIRLKATFTNDDERLWPGSFVNVRLVLSTRMAAPTVPSQTVQQGATGHYVYVIKADNTVERRTVEVAAIQDGVAVLAKGLAAGEKIVIEGQYRLTNGARVKISGPSPGASS